MNANITLEKLGHELNKEQANLSCALAWFAARGYFGSLLENLASDLSGSEEASTEFHSGILAHSKRLGGLEAEVRWYLLVTHGSSHPVLQIRKIKESKNHM